MSKIGIGIVTCDRPDFLSKCIKNIDLSLFDAKVIVNDGKVPVKHKDFHIIHNSKNLGVGKSKNRALRYMFDHDCDYIFLLEDDMLVFDNVVFEKYIEASKRSGIQHFNYGPGSPFNRKQTIAYDVYNRGECDQHSDPVPKKIVDYGNNVKVVMYQHSVAMFTFYTKKCLEEVGFIDEDYYNAWEHVDHTYRIAKARLHPPFWWFADIQDSHKLIGEAPQAIDKSSIAKDEDKFMENVIKNREIYLEKHGHYPNQVPTIHEDSENIVRTLQEIKRKHSEKYD